MNRKILTLVLLLFQINAAFSQVIVHQWIKYAGGSNIDQAACMAVDDEKNLYITGSFQDTLYFDATKLNSRGSSDIFLIKYDNTGKVIWAKNIGGKGLDQAHTMVIDSKKNIYLCGKYQGAVLFEKKQLIANSFSENFISKFNSDGKLIWLRTINAKTRNEKTLLALDNKDNIYYAGTFYKNITIDNLTYQSKSAADIFIALLNENGEFLNSVSIGGIGDQKIFALESSEIGPLYITGSFENSINFDNCSLQSKGQSDIFIARLDELKTKWASRAGGAYQDFASTLCINNNQLLIGGSFTEEAVFEKTSLLSDGVLDAFVAAYDNEGNILWAQKFGGPANEYINSLLSTSDGSIYIGGNFRGKIQKMKNNLESTNFSNDIFLTKFTNFGDFLWSKSFGGNLQDFAVQLIKDKDNNLYQTGSYSKNFKLGKEKAFQQGNSDDLFINKFYDCGLSKKIDLGNDSTICEGSQLTIKGEYSSYLWNNGSTQSFISVKQSGTYSVVATDAFGCKSEDEIVIQLKVSPELDLGPDLLRKTSESITLSPDGEFSTYLWSDGSTNSTLFLKPIENEKTEQISLMVSSENGCTATDEIMVTRKTSFDSQNELEINRCNTNYRLFPNPCTGKFSIIGDKSVNIEQIDFFDVKGNKIKCINSEINIPLKVDLSDLPKGTYLVIISETENIYEFKVVVE